VISRFISALLNNEQLVIYGDGDQTRDFVYVSDVVKANVIASSSATGVYNIACQKSISLNTLAEVMGKILGKRYIRDMNRPGRETSGILWQTSAGRKAWATIQIIASRMDLLRLFNGSGIAISR